MTMRAFIHISELCFHLPNGEALFKNLNVDFSHQKIGLVGRNGVGKSTLFKLLTRELQPFSGAIQVGGSLFYLPQEIPSLVKEGTILGLLGCEEKWKAHNRILAGSICESDFALLNEEWNLKQQIETCLERFSLAHLSLEQKLSDLSGGELRRLLLAKAFNAEVDFLLLDEPSNHLDQEGCKQLYAAMKAWPRGLLIASHNRSLLNRVDGILELHHGEIQAFSGNYSAYKEQKALMEEALQQEWQEAVKKKRHIEKSLQASQEKRERKQAYGRALEKNGRIDKLSANAAKERSEGTAARLSKQGEVRLKEVKKNLQALKNKMPHQEEIQLSLPKTAVPQGKIIVKLESVSFTYAGSQQPLIQDFNLTIKGPERIAIQGKNGSGKTTLVKLLLKELEISAGRMEWGIEHICYLDQQLNLLDPNRSLLENFLQLNPDANENHAYHALAQFAFRNTQAMRLVKHLSGGEKLRAALACVLLSSCPPQCLILDEPSNHLDIESLEKVEESLRYYEGMMLVISHDESFLAALNIERFIQAPFLTIPAHY